MRSRVIAGSLAEDMGRQGVIPIIRTSAARADKNHPISPGLQALEEEVLLLGSRRECTVKNYSAICTSPMKVKLT